MKIFTTSLLLLSNLVLISTVSGVSGQTWQAINKFVSANSADQQLALVNNQLERLEADLPNFRELFADGLLAKSEMDSYEAKHTDLLAAQQSLQDQIARLNRPNPNKSIAAVSRASSARSSSVKVKPTSYKSTGYRSTYTKNSYSTQRTSARPGRYSTRNVVLKSTSGSFIPVDTMSELREFYSEKFNETLPISAEGQSSTHDRLGWDHRGRIDVALSPDSERGQAVIEFLRTHNVAFIGFRASVTGCSTGQHIHIGPPSSRSK